MPLFLDEIDKLMSDSAASEYIFVFLAMNKNLTNFSFDANTQRGYCDHYKEWFFNAKYTSQVLWPFLRMVLLMQIHNAGIATIFENGYLGITSTMYFHAITPYISIKIK